MSKNILLRKLKADSLAYKKSTMTMSDDDDVARNPGKWKSAFWYPVQKYRMKPIKNDIYLFYVPFGI